MLILQRETGARPSELRHMSWDQIDQSEDLWVYRPVHHKNSHRGDSRNIYLTKAAHQAVCRASGDKGQSQAWEAIEDGFVITSV